jgi:hypothetical protein
MRTPPSGWADGVAQAGPSAGGRRPGPDRAGRVPAAVDPRRRPIPILLGPTLSSFGQTAISASFSLAVLPFVFTLRCRFAGYHHVRFHTRLE